MADPTGLQPPTLDPSQYPAFLDAQRKQQLAQMLMGAFQQSNQTPQDWNSMKVVPRRGMLQNVSVLANALMAGKAQKDSLTSQQNYFQGLYGGSQPQPTPTGPGAGIVDPNAPPDAQAAAQAVTSGNVAHQPTQQPQQNPLLPPGMPRGQAQAYLAAFGPEAYTKMLQGTPEWQTALRANNGNVQAAMTQLRAKGIKEGAIANRGGEENMLPIGLNQDGSVRYQSVRTPNLSPDMDYTRDPNTMSVVEAHNIPGAVPALATQKGATTAADVANTPRMIPMGGGSEALRYPGDVAGLGTPPALRTPQAPTTNQPGQAPLQQNASRPAPVSSQQSSRASAPPASSALPQKDASGILSNNLWTDIPKMVVPSSPGQTSNDYQKALTTSAAKKHQELVDKFGEQSASGVQQLEYLTEAERSLPKAEVGPMSEWLTHNRGVLVQQFPALAGALGGDKVTPTLELNKQLTNAALQGARTTFGTRMTQNEVNLQKDEMSPSPAMTRDALASLIHQAKMKAAYGIQQDKDYSDYHAQNGDPNRFESQYNVRRPITRFAAQYDTPPAALERLRQQPQTVADFKARYGWDPSK